ncbi:MAG: hypothetical protein K5930_04925 [Treponemataceae bacterium]|nr:hypothetical protein [Treponemataceae bacterium]
MSKKSLLFLILFFIFVNYAFTQVGANVNDEFYEDVVQWEIAGRIQKLPMIRPYPLALIKDVLLKVMECDDEYAAEKATLYYRQFFEDSIFRVGVDSNAVLAIEEEKDNLGQIDINPFALINSEFLDKGSVSFFISPFFTNKSRGSELLPSGKSPKYSYESDTSSLGSMNIFASTSSMVAYGTPDVYIQAGMARSSFGNFYNDGILINNKANQNGHISFSINKEKISFSLGMLMLTATDVKGESRFPQKYFYFHSLRYSPFPFLDLTLYESAMTGPRFDFSYMIPTALYMPVQHLIGFDRENLMMGFQVGYLIGNSLRLTGDLCIDDMNFNSIVKFNFDTKMKFAAQLGAQFAPSGKNMLKILYLDYTVVAPYMYSHSEYDGNTISYGVNYQNHTTNGKSLGAQLHPNSDRIRLGFKLEILDNLKFLMETSIIRHCNINENLPFSCIKEYLQEDADHVNTSGNIFDYPDAGNGYFSYCQDNFMFLTQTTKYVCMQNSMKVEYDLEIGKRNTLSTYMEWVYQFERNVGIDRNIFTGGHTEEEATEALRAAQLSAWRESLENRITNFLSIGLKYTY